MDRSTAAQKPPERPSDEGDAPGLRLAKKQGKVFLETLNHMVGDIAETGNQRTEGDYIIALAIEKAEGLYLMQGGSLAWNGPGDKNIHIEIVVCDRSDYRFIPGLNVTVTVSDSEGVEIGSHLQPFLWHPYLYHYGRDWKVRSDGKYSLHVHIDPPNFPRHDKVNGNRYREPVDVEFTGVKFETGQG